MSEYLTADFFDRPAETVARELLGKYLCRRTETNTEKLIINETEAYIGPQDLACHASKGLTGRTAVMFKPGGCWYIYLIYGMYYLLNVVTGVEGYPSAVLIRGAGNLNGPGKLTKQLRINKSFNGKPADISSGLWIEDNNLKLTESDILATPRIGVGYAGAWAKKPLRFVMKNERLKIKN